MALQINYLAAAKSQGVVADAKLLRRGKEMCFVEVDVQGEDGRPIAHATTVVAPDTVPASIPHQRHVAVRAPVRHAPSV